MRISHFIDILVSQVASAIEQILGLFFVFSFLGDSANEYEQESSNGANDSDPPGCFSVLGLLFGKRKQPSQASNVPPSFFKISLSHPKYFSKRFTSPFVIHIYLPEARQEVDEKLKTDFDKQELTEHLYDSNLTIGRKVKIKLWSPEITFSDPVTKGLESKLNTISFLGRPSDDCQPGTHWASLIISDEETGHEIQSIDFSVQIVDFAFDHISRPLLSNTVALILGVGSIITYLLTLLGQIDTTFGLASGTVVGIIASVTHMRFLTLYQRLGTTQHP